MSHCSPPEPWLKFCLIPGVDDAALRKLIACFGGIDAAAAASVADLRQALSPRLAEAIQAGPDPNLLVNTLGWLERPNHFLLTWMDPDYPPLLREIADAPPVLYALGHLDLLSRPSLAIIGSRHATAHGECNAEAFAEALSNAGLTIISGLAVGIDTGAHRGGLKAQGSSIAVVGTGLDRVHPAANKALAHAIADKGLLLSEFSLGTPSVPDHLRKRNRIISGLSLGVLVAEATLHSDSLLTARLAREQGREVFAIPGSIHSPRSRGCDVLIQQGAKLVKTANDVLEELGWPVMPAVSGAGAGPNDALLKLMGHVPVSLDTLIAITGLTVEALSAKLLALEGEGYVTRLPDEHYQQLF
ncbi:MAG: DNA-processing protein DprA [Thiobacillaceae bacterium]